MIKLLAKLSDEAFTELHDPERGADFLYLDRKHRYFSQGYVDMALPRSAAITEVIQAGTTSYALWTDENGIVDEFGNWQDAIDAFQQSRFEYQPRVKREAAEMTNERADEPVPASVF